MRGFFKPKAVDGKAGNGFNRIEGIRVTAVAIYRLWLCTGNVS